MKYFLGFPLAELALRFLFTLRMLHIPAYAPYLILNEGLSTGLLIQIAGIIRLIWIVAI
jgi:hypothetical protein